MKLETKHLTPYLPYGFTEEFGIPKEVFSSGADGAAVFIEELTKSEWLKLKDKFDEQTGKHEE